MREPGESAAVQIECEGVVTRAKDIYSHVELPSSEEQRVEDVPLAYIVLGVDFFIGAFPAVDV